MVGAEVTRGVVTASNRFYLVYVSVSLITTTTTTTTTSTYLSSPLPLPLSTPGKFMTRWCLFCMPWLVTGYMHVYSLRILDCTDVMALYSAHVSFVFLLSWVILHDQFVGVRVSRLTGREGVDGRRSVVCAAAVLCMETVGLGLLRELE
ncbi:hypothetical protein O3P69_012736 [Scylla paramamosain]|uniref:Uncharacterized protein n=1 Tax=Scylla paramamosain TaxID=85552 RepID=A0AAW0SEA8_SCYPA